MKCLLVMVVLCCLLVSLSHAIPTKSIRDFLKSPNDESLDQWTEVNTALTACSNNSFILQVDCKIFLDISVDIARAIFIESGTNVQFTPDGLFIVNNMWTPAFVFVNTVNVTFNGWNIKYTGFAPATTNYGYMKKNGSLTYFTTNQYMTQANQFSDITLKNYMINNRNVKYDSTNPTWAGPSATGATFSIRGSSQFLNFTNLYVYASKNSPGSDFVPFLFHFGSGIRSNQVVTPALNSNFTLEHHAVPSDMLFYNVTLDGTVMAFQGNLQRTTFRKIRSYRYSDVQDLAWDHAGSMGKLFPPPHLFYLNYNDASDPRLFNINLTLSDIVDYGQRVGLSRDKSFGDTVSGDARSLKIGGVNVIIDNYQSYRPDGFLDLLSSNNLVMRNVKATFDTAFMYFELVPIRFTSSSYKNILIDGLETIDTAVKTSLKSFGGFGVVPYTINFKNMKFTMNTFTGSIPSLYSWGPKITGSGVNINYSYCFINPASNKREVASVNFSS